MDEELHPRCRCHGVEYMLSTKAVGIAGDRCLNQVWLWLTKPAEELEIIKLRRGCGIGAQDKAREVTSFDAI